MNWDRYKQHIKESLDNFEFSPEILTLLRNSCENDQTIFVAGNGGSAAIADHYACDLSKGATQDWSKNFKRYRVVSLVNNIGYLTAIANDEHYSQVFTQQLINLAKPGDILMLISSSGNSPNVVQAAEWGKANGLTVIGITGFDGGKLHKLSHYTAHITHDRYEVCEDIHHVFGQFLATHLREGKPETPLKKA